MADDDIKKKLDELRQEAADKLFEARAIVSQMNVVERLFGLPPTALADLETTAVAAATVPLSAALGEGWEPRHQGQPPRRTVTQIRPDEYFGDEPLEAAKKYMRGVGHAVPFDEITDAVQRGGAVTKGADWRERLEISLKRSPYQVITVAEKTYGLADFYSEEQLKRFRGRRGDAESAPKKKAKDKGGWPKGKSRGTATSKSQAAPKKKADATTPADESTG